MAITAIVPRRRSNNHERIPEIAHARVEGWTDFAHRSLPIGGILAIVKANRRVDVSCEVNVDNDRAFIRGCLRPPVEAVPITVLLPDNKRRGTQVSCDAHRERHAASTIDESLEYNHTAAHVGL